MPMPDWLQQSLHQLQNLPAFWVIVSVILTTAGTVGLWHVIQNHVHWFGGRWWWLKLGVTITAFCSFTLLIVGAGMTYQESSSEAACLAQRLNRSFRRGVDFNAASPEKLESLRNEARLIAVTIIKRHKDTHTSLCDIKWQVFENTVSFTKGMGRRVIKALLGYTPKRNLRKETLAQVAHEQYGIFTQATHAALEGDCVVRESKPRKWLLNPRILHPFSGYRKVHESGSVTVYCAPGKKTAHQGK